MASLHVAQQILDIMWPVGSIYLSDNATNPNTKFGGTWVKLSGGFIYGSTLTSGNTYSTGNGTGTATNSHTLTVAELPNHNHYFQSSDGTWHDPTIDRSHTTSWGASYSDSGDYKINSATGQKCDGAQGKGHSHNIPYIACSIWRRTA